LQKTGREIAVQSPCHRADKSDARKRVDRREKSAHIGSDPHEAEQKHREGDYEPNECCGKEERGKPSEG
jgi:hypothetical protein